MQGRDPGARVDQWLARHAAPVDALKRVVVDLRTGTPRISRLCPWLLQAVRRLARLIR